jgi:hypothetical protein
MGATTMPPCGDIYEKRKSRFDVQLQGHVPFPGDKTVAGVGSDSTNIDEKSGELQTPPAKTASRENGGRLNRPSRARCRE